MKPQTKSGIFKAIQGAGKLRPVELRDLLKISAQALHRHLRAMVDEGILEVQGKPPLTHYALAGVPDLTAVSDWLNAPTMSTNPGTSVCETREVLAGRLPRLKSFLENGLPETRLSLVISTAGEIGNNSFDHNLGQWRDVPGCWFESQVSGGYLWICIGDRGQGIYQSLIKVHPHFKDDQSALKAAFETIISGRAPEQRGNGLKYVRHILSTTAGCGLACLSGKGRLAYGERGETCLAPLAKHFTDVKGTVTLMNWRLG